MTANHTFFANCARGCEPLLIDELEALGASAIRQQRGGALFSGPRELGWRCCLHLRTSSRVLRQLNFFDARDKKELYDGVKHVDWSTLIGPDDTLAVRATSRKSRLNHTGYIALRTKDAVVDQMREVHDRRPSVDTDAPTLPITVHIASNRAAVFADLVGAPLFKRGYRQADGGGAPIKETLAASLVLMAHYDPNKPLLDPFCGNGTIPIEAAMVAANVPPGADRPFAFTGWRGFTAEDAQRWQQIQDEAQAAIRPAPDAPTLFGFDADPATVRMARANAARAGVEGWVQFEVGDALDVAPPVEGPGLVLVNPPYGERLGEEEEVAKMVRSWGFHLKDTASGWRVAVISGQASFRKAFPMRPSGSTELFNGAIRCRLYEYEIF